MLTRYFLAVILLAAASIPAYGLSSAQTTGDTSAVGGTVKLILDIIPDNLIAPFAIDNEALPIALVFGTIAGYALPAINGFCLQLELLMTAKKMHLVDESKLHS